jgi:Polycomb-like MTF2 factor 2
MKIRIVEPNAGPSSERVEMTKEVEDAKRSLDFEICDSSDDTSSKSTLDLIIPRPDNFKGFNNPFHSNYRSDAKMIEKMSEFVRRSGGANGNLSKFPEVRIVRTIKRRLSAKDILQGPNQEFKRRKFHKRRKSSDVEVISEIIQPINMPLPQYIPVRTESNSNFSRISMPMPFGLKSRSESTSTIKAQPVTTANSIKIDSVINSPKKSISLYFGAKNRIENGEKFTIMAKRTTFDGKDQYLLEWENQNNKSSANVQQNES